MPGALSKRRSFVFLVLSILTLLFGPQFVRIFGSVFREHWALVLGAIALGLAIWLVVLRMKKKTVAPSAP